MPAMDYLNKVAEVTHDISASATASATRVNMARAGLTAGMHFVVVVTALSAADFTSGSTRRLRFYFEYTTDNGTTYHRAGVAEGKIGASGIPLQIVQGVVTADIVPEQNADGDLDWRVTSDIDSTLADADDFSWIAYLGGGPVGAQAPIE